VVSLREFYRSVHNGPLVTEQEFLGMSFFERLQSLAKEYGITCDPHDYFLPTDESLADDLFKAGKALLEEKGLWCMDTSRLVEFTGKEVDESLQKLPTEVTFGEGTEEVTVKHRSAGDKRQPVKLIGG
jgi:methylamine--corrinoid protein Co-methyltransferase